MKHSVRLLSVAEEDLTSILDYISIENRPAAQALLENFEEKISVLGEYPLSGRLPFNEFLRKLGYRYLVVSNYLVFYVFRQKEVVVHRILHGARNYLELLSGFSE